MFRPRKTVFKCAGLAGFALLSLSGCAVPMAVPAAISAAGGAAYLVKEVLDIDISYRQLKKENEK